MLFSIAAHNQVGKVGQAKLGFSAESDEWNQKKL